MRLVVAALAALAVAAAGCGGVENEPNLAQTAQRTEDTGSFRMATSWRYVSTGQEAGWTCEDAFDYVRDRSRRACRHLHGQPTTEWIVIGGTAYVRAPWGDGVHWSRSRAREVEQSSPARSPESLLATLRAATHETDRIGEEDVRGAPAVRYRLAVFCEEAGIDDCPGETETVDVWIDDEGLLRRLSGEQSALTWDVELFDFGATLEIEPPPADEIAPARTDDAPAAVSAPCRHDKAGPVLVGQATEALRRQGFEVAADTRAEGASCPESVAAHLTNARDQHPVWGALQRGAGLLTCTVYVAERPAHGEVSFTFPQFASGMSPHPVDRELENLHCFLFAEGPRAEERIERLDAAFAELRREVRG
jgi:hypothetical protein